MYIICPIVLFSCGQSGINTRKQSFLHKGNLAVKEEMFKEAERFYREAIGLDSNYAEAHNNLGIVLENQGKNEAALISFNTAIRSDSTFYDAYFNRANLLVDMGKDSLALQDLHRIAGQKDKKEQIAALVGMANFHLKQYTQASAAFRQTIQLDSANAEHYINLGTVQFYQGKFENARRNIQHGISINPEEANGYNVLGMMAVKENDTVMAKKYLNRALELDAENPYFLNNRGYLYLQKGELDKGLKDIDESMALKPENPWVYRNKGLYYLKTNDFENALRVFIQAREMDATLELINFYTGNTYAALGNLQLACKYWQQSADLGEMEGKKALLEHCGQLPQ